MMRWAKNVKLVEEMKKFYKTVNGKSEWERPLGCRVVSWRKIIKRILTK
jgi:hypothetical protein